jgi:glyoxylase I family protein
VTERAPRIGGQHHVAIVTADLPAAERFYLEVLGLSLRARHLRPDGVHRATWVDLPDGTFLALELGEPGPGRDDSAPGLHCLALGIDQADRESWRNRLAAAGHPVERESRFTLYVRDPAGVLIGLSHHPTTRMDPGPGEPEGG